MTTIPSSPAMQPQTPPHVVAPPSFTISPPSATSSATQLLHSTSSRPSSQLTAKKPMTPSSLASTTTAGTSASTGRKPSSRTTVKSSAASATDEPLPIDPGVTHTKITVEIEAEVRRFVPSTMNQTQTAYDQRFTFVWPNGGAASTNPVITTGHQSNAAATATSTIDQIITPPTGLWEIIPTPSSVTSSVTSSSSPATTRVRWSHTFDSRFDRHTLMAWEHLFLDVQVEERSLEIEPEIESANENVSETTKRASYSTAHPPSSNSATASRTEKETKEQTKEQRAKEKEKARKKKEKEAALAKRLKESGGLPLNDEPERVSFAHPRLEEDDVPWLKSQATNIHLSPMLFAPFSVAKKVELGNDQTSAASTSTGLISYSLRIISSLDPIPSPLRLTLNPLMLTLHKIENLSHQPCSSWKEMAETYKPVYAKCEMWESGLGNARNGMDELDATIASTASVVPLPRPTLLTSSLAHSSTLHFHTSRVVYIGLYSRAALVAQLQSQQLKVEVFDREHKESWTPEEVRAEEERLRALAEAELQARLAEEQVRRKKMRRTGQLQQTQSQTQTQQQHQPKPSMSFSSGERLGMISPPIVSASPDQGAGGDSDSDTELDISSDNLSLTSTLTSNPVLSHLDFKQLSVEEMLTQAKRKAEEKRREMVGMKGKVGGMKTTAAVANTATSTSSTPPHYLSSQNLHGVASFSFTDLFLSSTRFTLSSPIRAVFPAKQVKMIPPEKGRVERYGLDESEGRNEQACVTIEVRISYPLSSPLLLAPPALVSSASSLPSLIPPTTNLTPLSSIHHKYSRAIFILRYKDDRRYRRLLALIADVNCRSLGVGGYERKRASFGGNSRPVSAVLQTSSHSDIDPTASLLALGALQLTPQQQSPDSTLDVVCSFQVCDESQRIVIIEGISEWFGGRAVKAVVEGMEKMIDTSNEEQRTVSSVSTATNATTTSPSSHQSSRSPPFKLLSSSSITFPSRLYSAYHVLPKNIRLKHGTTFQSLGRKGGMYVGVCGSGNEVGGSTESTGTFASSTTTQHQQSLPSHDTGYSCFILLHTLLSTPSLSVAQRNSLFPTVSQLESLEKRIGGDVEERDIVGGVPRLEETIVSSPVPLTSTEIQRPRSRGQAYPVIERSFDTDYTAVVNKKKMQSNDRLEREKHARDEVRKTGGEEFGYEYEEECKSPTDFTSTFQPLLGTASAFSSIPATSRTRRSDAEVMQEGHEFLRRKKDVSGTAGGSVNSARKYKMSTDYTAYAESIRTSSSSTASMTPRTHSTDKTSYIRRNISAICAASHALSLTKSPDDYPRYITAEELGVTELHPYANQALNVYELQKRKLREKLKEEEELGGGKKHHTYNSDYLSSSFSLIDPQQEANKEKEQEKEKWTTQDGFRYPPHKTYEESWRDEKWRRDQEEEDENGLEREDAVENRGDKISNLELSSSILHHSVPFRPPSPTNALFGSPTGDHTLDQEFFRSLHTSAMSSSTSTANLERKHKDKEEWQRKLMGPAQWKSLMTGSGQVGRQTTLDDVRAQKSLQLPDGRSCFASSSDGVKHIGLSTPLPSQPARVDLVSSLLHDLPQRSGLKFQTVKQDEHGVRVRKNYSVAPVPISVHASQPYVEPKLRDGGFGRGVQEEKERMEREDGAHTKPRFSVATAGTTAQSFLYKRKINP